MSEATRWITPEGQGEGEGLAAYRDLIAAAHPDLAGAPLRLLTAGWDCVGLDVDDRLIVKVPRDAEAAVALEAEARLLALVRPAVSMAVPDMRLVREPRLHSLHPKLRGEHLLAADYAAMPEPARAGLAEDLALFFAELHAIPLAAARAAGADAEPPWPALEEIARLAVPLLPKDLRTVGLAVLDAFARRGPDPLGEVLGHFDAHGWNMAWDHGAQRLNGLYDFGDAGIDERHREFVAPGLISADLVARTVAAYGRRSGLTVDPGRVAILAAAHRLRELAEEARDPTPFALAQAAEWVGAWALAKTARDR